MESEARHFVDEAFFVISGKYLKKFQKSGLTFVHQPYREQKQAPCIKHYYRFLCSAACACVQTSK